jgi:hypothetical protein
MPRRPKAGEIEETLAKAYNVTAIPKTGSEELPDLQLIEQIVAERIGPKSALREFWPDAPLGVFGLWFIQVAAI